MAGLPIKECTMRIRLTFVAPLLVAGAAAVAVTAAPIAAAAPAQAPVNPPAQQSCATSGPGTVCQSPGNVQINNAPPPVSFIPMAAKPFCSEPAVCAPSRTNHEEESQRGT